MTPATSPHPSNGGEAANAPKVVVQLLQWLVRSVQLVYSMPGPAGADEPPELRLWAGLPAIELVATGLESPMLRSLLMYTVHMAQQLVAHSSRNVLRLYRGKRILGVLRTQTQRQRNREVTMDTTAWELRIHRETEWAHWSVFLSALVPEFGSTWQTGWSLTLLADICEACGVPGHPENLPHNHGMLRDAVQARLGNKGPSTQSLGLRVLRCMLSADPRCAQVYAVFPRYRKVERMNKIARQRNLVVEDALPKKEKKPWISELLRGVLEHEASGAWRTSKSANQSLYMLRNLLQRAGFLDDVDSVAAFHERLRTLPWATKGFATKSKCLRLRVVHAPGICGPGLDDKRNLWPPQCMCCLVYSKM